MGKINQAKLNKKTNVSLAKPMKKISVATRRRSICIKKGQKKPEHCYTCKRSGCDFKTAEYKDMDEHIFRSHFCKKCEKSVVCMNRHVCCKRREEPIPEIDLSKTSFSEKHRSNKGAIKTLIHDYESGLLKIEDAVSDVYDELELLLENYVKEYKGMLVKFTFTVNALNLKTEQERPMHFQSKFTRVINTNFIGEVIVANMDYINNVIALLTETGSGIKILNVNRLELCIGIYRPTRPQAYIKTPKGLRQRRGLLNIKCDEDCFKLSVLARLYENMIVSENGLTDEKFNKWKPLKRKLENPKYYIKVFEKSNLDFEEFDGDCDLNDLPEWEIKNSVSVNVYKYNEQENSVHPIITTSVFFGIDRHVNLLLLENKNNSHLVLIRNISKFFCQKNTNKKYFCPFCHQGFKKEKHIYKCKIMNEVGLEVPKNKNKRFRFRDWHKCLPPPYRMYSDMLYYQDEKSGETGVAGFGFVVIGPNGELIESKFYIGKNAVEQFLEHVIPEQLPLPEMTNDENEKFNEANQCIFCFKFFTDLNRKVRHHSHHMKGFPEQCVCNTDNLKIKPKRVIPMFSHTQDKLGNHMIIQKLRTEYAQRIQIIPRSNENFMAVIFDRTLKLVDSRKFLDFAFPDLVKRLVESGKTDTFTPFYDDLEANILLQPFYFPHTYFTSHEKLQEKRLPPQEHFQDLLCDKEFGTAEYESAVSMYQKLKCENFSDYCLVYLKSRVYQTAAVMEEFGEWCFNQYMLTPLYDVSLASYAYSLATFDASEKFDIPTDHKIIDMVLKNVRGGVSHLAKRVVTANSERLGHKDVKDEERIEILAADLNSEYQHCLLQPLPSGEYRLMSAEEIENINVLKLSGNKGKGWILNVSLVYPKTIKYHTQDFPFCATKENLRERLQIKNPENKLQGNTALVLTQNDKEEVAVYYKLLQFFVRHGMIVKKIHDVVEFTEEPYLRGFITKNLSIRKSTPDKFHQQISKNIGNMIFGKFLSINNNINVQCSTSQGKAEDLLARHNYEEARIISPDVSLFYMKKKKTILNKNILVSFVVLDLAKLRLYELIYEVLKPIFRDRILICASETDSLICEIKDPNKTFLQDLEKCKDAFDFSTLPKDHILFDNSRAKEPGLLKIEYPYALQFVGVKSKLYSIKNKCQDCLAEEIQDVVTCESCQGKDLNVPKGCSKKKHTPHDVYLKAATGSREQDYVTFWVTESKNQKVSIKPRKKNLFCATDNRRIWLTNNESVPYGFDI